MKVSKIIKQSLGHLDYIRRENLKERTIKGVKLLRNEFFTLRKDCASLNHDIGILEDIHLTLQNTLNEKMLDKLERLINELSNSRSIYDRPHLDF
jgi:hypothetical protein